MKTIDEIQRLENELREAELGPDATFFEDHLADDVLLDGELAKKKVVAAHRTENGPKFTRVEIGEYRIFDHGDAAVVTCRGDYESPKSAFTLKFMRVWLKKGDRWQIIAGTISPST
jgi:hypothetical protein